ncbi:MAG: peptidylprolyl isomerase [Myxococcales bacterium]|nr:peptidylprolyl isomerase [Myxococcales bacterium]MDH5306562.1 peptidylprolyl isomerase [Myxococcales bacterium]MDH5566795.1 peptidylprolyl isomerase [Myxococcales bacterium]
MRRASALLLSLAVAALACDRDPRPAPDAMAPPALPHARVAAGPHDVAVIDLGGLGTIRFELLPEIAPQTVANFVTLASQGFYDGTYFHRVIPGFMIQGGDPATKNADPRDDGEGGPQHSIPDEFTDYTHLRGSVSMANKGFPDSGGSQFFIVHQDAPHLDGHYSVFGRVIEGIEVVDAITQLEVDVYGRYGPRDRPYPVNATVQSIRIEEAVPGAR